jgi:hypothetical protein
MKLDTATILGRTFALLRADPVPGIIAAMVLITISTVVKTISPGEDRLLFWLADLVGVSANFLVVAMVARQAGLLREGGMAMRLLTFLLLWVMTGTLVLIGFFLLILPGLYLWSRWSIVVPLAVAEGRSPLEAVAESWRRTRSIVAPISAAIVLAGSGFIAAVVLGFVFRRAEPEMRQSIGYVGGALGYLSTVLLWYLSIAIHDLIRPDGEELEKVFA